MKSIECKITSSLERPISLDMAAVSSVQLQHVHTRKKTHTLKAKWAKYARTVCTKESTGRDDKLLIKIKIRVKTSRAPDTQSEYPLRLSSCRKTNTGRTLDEKLNTSQGLCATKLSELKNAKNFGASTGCKTPHNIRLAGPLTRSLL